MRKAFLQKVFTAAVVMAALLALPAAAQTQWVKNIGGTDATNDAGYETAADNNGNVFVVGVFAGQNIDFGNNIIRTSTPTVYGNYDFFIAKYSRAGLCQWVRNMPGAAVSGGVFSSEFSITVDPAGNPIVAGQYDGGDVDFGGIRSGRNSGNFIAKYHTSGACFWISTNWDSARYYTGVGQPTSLTTDNLGNVYATGTVVGRAVIFGASFQVNADPNVSNMYVAKYNPSGQIQWVYTNEIPPGVHPVAWGIRPNDIRWAGDDNLYISGVYGGTRLRFPGGYAAPLDSFNLHTYAVRMKTNGSVSLLTYTRGFGGYYASTILPALDDYTGSGYYVAAYSGHGGGRAFDFGNGFTVRGDSAGLTGNICFLIKYDYYGTVQWVRAIKTSWWAELSNLKRDRAGNIYFAMALGGALPVDFGGKIYQPVGQDIVIAKYSPYGTCLAIRAAPGTGNSYIQPRGFEIDRYQDIIVTGSFRGSYSFTPLPAISSPEMNAFIVKSNALDFTAGDSLKFILNSRSVAAGDTASLFIRAKVPLDKSFTAIQMNISYDSTRLSFRGIDTAGTMLGKLKWATQYSAQNKIRLGAYGSSEIVEDGLLLRLLFKVREGSSGIARVSFDTTFVNTGSFAADTVNGWFSISGSVPVRDAGRIIPAVTKLNPGYPNPFNGQTTIRYDASERVSGEITVFDVTGKILRIIPLPEMPPGSYSRALDFGNAPSGIYFCRLRLNNRIFTQKLVLIK